MPALSNTPHQSGVMADDNGAMTVVQRAFADPASIGDNLIVAAVAGKSIRVLAAMMMNNVALAQSARFRSAANSISPLNAFGVVANGIMSYPFNPMGWFQTNAGEALNLNLTAATAVGVMVTYILV